jgi:hypothetical protein
VNIEGAVYDWERETITVSEIRQLGGLPSDTPVIEVDLKDNSEMTLEENAIVELKPGKGFGKKVKFTRGDAARIQEELSMLRGLWPGLEYVSTGHWVRLQHYWLGLGLWNCSEAEVCFQIPESLPGQAPYGFYVRPQLMLCGGVLPNHYTFPADATPFGSGWGRFSWQLDPWQPAADPKRGSNMVNFARSFADRLRQGQ